MNRTLLVGAVVLCLLPLIFLGPGLWRDFQSKGRWDVAAGLLVSDVSCFGRAPFIEFCSYTIAMNGGLEIDRVTAAAVGVEISLRPTAVVRARGGHHLSLPMLVSTSGLTARITAIVLLEFFVILVTLIARRDAKEKNRLAAEMSARRRADLIGLLRDRRDHF